MHNSREHVQGAQRFDVSAHLETSTDLVSLIPDCGTFVKLYTAAMSNSSEEPRKIAIKINIIKVTNTTHKIYTLL